MIRFLLQVVVVGIIQWYHSTPPITIRVGREINITRFLPKVLSKPSIPFHIGLNFRKLTGGYPSGFRNSEKGIFKPRLLVFHGVDNKHTVLTEVPFARKTVSSDDVFILDLGTKAYQWNGNGANKDERYRASLYLQQLKSERLGRCQTFVVDESDGEGTAEFFSHLPDAALPRSKAEQGVGRRAIYRLSDETGKLKVTLMCEDRLDKSVLTQDDAYFIDTGKALFVYIGEKCSRNEKRNAFSYANAYLKQTNHPFVPITVVSGNMDSDELAQVLE